MSIFIYLVAFALIYGLWTLTVKRGLKNLSCTRAFSQLAVFEGDEGELIEVVRNDKPYFIPWLRVESKISPHIRLGNQDNLHVNDRMYYCSLFTMMPYQQVRRKHKVRFLHRGAYDLGNASLTAGDLLGISQSQRTQELRVPILVYPKLLDSSNIPLPMSRMLGDLSNRRQLLQDPFMVRGIRPYQPGDPVRDIHWPATARTGDVQVRIHDYTTRTKLMVVLNMQMDDVQWQKHLAEKDEPVIEYGISLAATICIQALRNGLAVGFAANMPRDDSNESTILMPQDGAAREEELLTSFARLQIRRSETFPILLDSLTKYSDLDILILSTYDSEGLQSLRHQLQRSGNQVSFHLFQGGES